MDGDNGSQKCLSYPSRQPEDKSTLPRSVELVAPEDFPNVNWITPKLEKEVQSDKPEDDVCPVDDTSPSENNTVPTTFPSSPPLQNGSSLHRLDEILTRHWDNDTPEYFVANMVAEIRYDYDTRLSKDIAQGDETHFPFLPSFDLRFRYMARAHQDIIFPELLATQRQAIPLPQRNIFRSMASISSQSLQQMRAAMMNRVLCTSTTPSKPKLHALRTFSKMSRSCLTVSLSIWTHSCKDSERRNYAKRHLYTRLKQIALRHPAQ